MQTTMGSYWAYQQAPRESAEAPAAAFLAHVPFLYPELGDPGTVDLRCGRDQQRTFVAGAREPIFNRRGGSMSQIKFYHVAW